MSLMIGKNSLAAALIVVLAGCTALPFLSKAPHETAPAAPVAPKLDLRMSVFIALPDDGGSASLRYIGSGKAVSHAVAGAFSKHGVPVYLSGARMTEDDAIEAATRLKAGYAVLPVITWWDQRNKWLGFPSRLAIRIAIIDVATGRVIASKPIESHTLLASFSTPDPDSLLAGPLSKYVDTLY
jgi:hypothetical protein